MNRYFFTRVFALGLVLICLMVYQNKALAWEKQEQENQKEIAAVEAYNQEMKKQQQNEESALYVDGVYEGSAQGFGGLVVVSVTIMQDEITSVEVTEAKGEDSAYLSMAMVLTERIVNEQSIEVDTVSGATYSSNGILDATRQALDFAKAAKENS